MYIRLHVNIDPSKWAHLRISEDSLKFQDIFHDLWNTKSATTPLGEYLGSLKA